MPTVEVPTPPNESSSEGDVSTLYHDEGANWHTVTTKGRRVRKSSRFREEAATAVEGNFYSALSDDDDSDTEGPDCNAPSSLAITTTKKIRNPEVAAVGAGKLHKDVQHTDLLKVMTYKEAMASNCAEEWDEAVFAEYQRFVKHEAVKPVPRDEVPKSAKVISTVWAMKNKANGVKRARINMRGYEQIPGIHFNPAWTSAPVACAMTIRIMLVLMLMSNWYAHIVDVMGAFLLGFFQNGEQIYTPVPVGWESFFPPNVLLLLLRTVYGLKQAANCFYILLAKTMKMMAFTKSHADPALFFK